MQEIKAFLPKNFRGGPPDPPQQGGYTSPPSLPSRLSTRPFGLLEPRQGATHLAKVVGIFRPPIKMCLQASRALIRHNRQSLTNLGLKKLHPILFLKRQKIKELKFVIVCSSIHTSMLMVLFFFYISLLTGHLWKPGGLGVKEVQLRGLLC